jgi:hypothetical protein
MQACSLLLGCHWKFDTDDVHHVEVINILLCTMERKLPYFLLPQMKLCNVIG